MASAGKDGFIIGEKRHFAVPLRAKGRYSATYMSFSPLVGSVDQYTLNPADKKKFTHFHMLYTIQ